jgi:hypothetical protein
MTETSQTRAALLLTAVFFFGLCCGAALFFIGQRSVHHAFGTPPPGMMGDPTAFLTRELDLDATQQQQVKQIVERHHADLDRIVQQTHSEIRAILRDDQKKKLDDFASHHHMGGHGRPGFAPPHDGPDGPPPGNPPPGGQPPPDRQ